VKVTVKIGPRFWDATVLAITAVEIYAIRSGVPESPWSHWWRKRLHLHTKPGRYGLYVGWSAFSLWLMRHLCNQTDSPSSVTLEL